MNPGDPAPDFTATAADGSRLSLSSLRGRWVVLYFYPKDNSPGCSLEARRFEAALPELRDLGAEVVGVSTDSETSHERFREGCGLSFPLVADRDRSVSRAYGVMGGLTGLLGVADRQSFLIDPEGRVAHRWRRVNPLSHPDEVRRELEARLGGGAGNPAVAGGGASL